MFHPRAKGKRVPFGCRYDDILLLLNLTCFCTEVQIEFLPNCTSYTSLVTTIATVNNLLIEYHELRLPPVVSRNLNVCTYTITITARTSSCECRRYEFSIGSCWNREQSIRVCPSAPLYCSRDRSLYQEFFEDCLFQFA